MAPLKTAADYAAIAVAPLLIFLMISSLANFLMLILYHGSYPQRVSWTLLMFTLGAVGIARIAIERDRAYALGYAGLLGIASFVAMLRFVDSPIFSLFILALIAYLADVIVRDCTLIDDTIDASGQGLIDSGRLFIKKQIRQHDGSEAENDASSDPPAASSKTHQPGRTVMYLAFAALPLFGLGQFFLRNTADVWARAQLLLAVYLFSALSLLVTTSFLGLRRYLRQRHVEMPGDVSVAWLAGGMAIIAAVLLIAFIAPLPGQALVSFELPKSLDSPSGNQASRHGWGNEGAQQSNPDAPGTTSDPNSQDKEVQSLTAQQGAPPGDVGDGNRDDGPVGKQKGGDQQPSGGGDKQKPPSSGDSSSQQESSTRQPSKSSQGEPSKGEPSKGESSKGESSKEQSGQKPDAPSGDSSSAQSGEQSDSQSASESESESGDDARQASKSKESSEPTAEPDQQPSEPQQQSQQSDSSQSAQDPSKQGSPASSSPGVTETLADAVPIVTTLIKFAIFLVLAGIVIAFLWVNRHLIVQWWEKLFSTTSEPQSESFDEFLGVITQVPPRAFASFRNPVGKESDVRRIVVITFQAFEAWTREQGTPRGKDETPSEFIRRVSQSVPQMSAPASQVVEAYNRIVYGRGSATQSDLTAATKVWQVMRSRS